MRRPISIKFQAFEEITKEQECENWVRDYLQSKHGATTEQLLTTGQHFGFKPWLTKRVLDNLNKNHYITRGKGVWLWHHGRIANLHNEPAYNLGIAIGQLKDVLNYMDTLIAGGGAIKKIAEMVKHDVERTLKDITR